MSREVNRGIVTFSKASGYPKPQISMELKWYWADCLQLYIPNHPASLPLHGGCCLGFTFKIKLNLLDMLAPRCFIMKYILFFSYIPLCSVALLKVEVMVQGTSSPQIEDKIPWSIGIPLTWFEGWDLGYSIFLIHTNSIVYRTVFLRYISP